MYRDEMSDRYRGSYIDASYQVSFHFGHAVSEETTFKKSANQKQELPATAMFVNVSGRNEQSL